MRYLLMPAYCLTLAAADPAQLRQLAEKDRIFDLRDMLDQADAKSAGTQLYRAMIASRFGREREAIDQLRAFLVTKPTLDMELIARNELAGALARAGDCRQAVNELATALRLAPAGAPGRMDGENSRVLLESICDVGSQSVEFGQPVPVQARRNELGLWTVPVEINSQRGDWIFDTGASLSTVSESEARRMGLAVRELKAYAAGSTQVKNPARLAVAPELRFGSARLHNVVFLVLTDEALFISQAKYQMRGILGAPEMRSLGCIGMSAEGALTVDCGAKPGQAPPNLFYDGPIPIVQVLHSGKKLQMMLDTGMNQTRLYPSIRDSLAQWERDQLSDGREADFGGAGGSERARFAFVPSIQLDLPGRSVYLSRLPLLRNAPAGTAGFRDGILGIDALAGGFRLDLRTMHLTLK
jgi:predicted aspartyl protease